MENPASKTIRALQFVILGILIGLVPGQIRIDQMRREMRDTVQSTDKQIAELKAKLKTLVDSDLMAQQTAIDRGKYHTLLISNGLPMPHRDFIRIEDPWSHLDISFTPGTIWVIPDLIRPHTLYPDDRAWWAVVDPQGHVGRWNYPSVDYTLGENAQ